MKEIIKERSHNRKEIKNIAKNLTETKQSLAALVIDSSHRYRARYLRRCPKILIWKKSSFASQTILSLEKKIIKNGEYLENIPTTTKKKQKIQVIVI